MPHCPNYSDDQSSMDSTNISVGGSSQQQTGSECPTRSTSPGPHDQSLVELQLRTKPQPPVTEGRNGSLLSPAVRRSLPNSDRLNKSTSVDVGSMEVPWHDMSVLKADEMTESNMVDQSHCSTSVKSMPINDPMVLYLNTIGGAFTEPFGSGEVENGLSSGTDDSSDEDLDLEQFANKFLSEKFGIGLGKIRRPHRIVDVFHQVEKKCVGILEDEGHGFIGSPCSEESQSEPVDGGDDMTYHPARGGPSHSTSGGPYTPTGTKRPSNDATDLEGASGPSHLTKSRRPKRRRTEGDFSCPYRKRNPRRFNIRDHEECANRSHRDISMLTKHITAYHCKVETRVCGRCNRNFRAHDALVAHLEGCQHLPPNRLPIQYNDSEDGIDYKAENMLKSRKSADQINDWETLWRRLFPTDTFVPSSDFEPVIEDHDLLYIYKCSQPQISRRLNALNTQGCSFEQIIAVFFEEIGTLFRHGGSINGQYLTPSSSPSTSLQVQSPVRDKDTTTIEREEDLTANPQFSYHNTSVSDLGGIRPPIQSSIRNIFEIDDGTMELSHPERRTTATYARPEVGSSTNALRQPSPQFNPQTTPNDQKLVDFLTELNGPLGQTGQSMFGHTRDNGAIDTLQSLAQPQHASFFTGTMPLNENIFPRIGAWDPNNIYASNENDPSIELSYFPGTFGCNDFNGAEYRGEFRFPPQDRATTPPSEQIHHSFPPY